MPKQIELYNSLIKKKEIFKPMQDDLVRIYHCGPTVYKRQHIGNMRRFLFADLIRRTMEFLGYDVKEITNITDVGHLTQDDIDSGEDKLEKEATRKKTSPQQIAKKETKQFFDDLVDLNIQPSHEYPRATKHIQAMHEMIKQLIDKGYAYETEVGVFYDISKFKKYGELSGNTVSDLADGARLAVRAEKRNPGDFALWLTDKPEQLQQWDSPWGRGYPGWHIECSAMSLKYLGDKIDIHTGGEDNKFPHHENEIAQSEAATGKKFVNTWMHNAHLQLSGRKLAKSEGRQITLDTITEKGFSSLAFRLLVFGSHYRTKIDFSWDKLSEAEESLKTIDRLLNRLQEILPIPKKINSKDVNKNTINKFGDALADDLNTPRAMAVIYDYIKQINKDLDEKELTKPKINTIWHTLLEMDRVFGVIELLANKTKSEKIPKEVRLILDERAKARKHGDFAKADKLRQEIEAHGYYIKDTSSGIKLEKNK